MTKRRRTLIITPNKKENMKGDGLGKIKIAEADASQKIEKEWKYSHLIFSFVHQ